MRAGQPENIAESARPSPQQAAFHAQLIATGLGTYRV
jgi:hypothetical protein